MCFMEVDHLCKLEALAQINVTLHPSDIYLAMDRFDEKSVDFQNKVKEMVSTNLQGTMKEGCIILHCTTKYTCGEGLFFVVL